MTREPIDLIRVERHSGAAALRNADTRLGLLNIVGNAVLYIPVGLLVPVVLRRSWLPGLLVGVTLSVGVELVQWITSTGSADIDDVIPNVLVAFLGALVGGYASRRLSAVSRAGDHAGLTVG